MKPLMLKNPHGRATPEWIGRDNDAVPPPRVVQRILERYHFKCHITGQTITGKRGVTWELEHVIAIANGGENRESNLAPVLIAPHKKKTARDRQTKSKGDRLIKKRFGIKPKSSQPVPGSRGTKWKREYDRATRRFRTVRRETAR